MPPPGTGVLSFGLVAIPVRIHTAIHSENVSFHLLHEKCGSRVRNRYNCPVCKDLVEREDLVRSFQHAKDQYVPITEEELENLEALISRNSSRLLQSIRFILKTLITSAPTKEGRSLTGY
jgi:non-homologous end joining protein Ku